LSVLKKEKTGDTKKRRKGKRKRYQAFTSMSIMLSRPRTGEKKRGKI